MAGSDNVADPPRSIRSARCEPAAIFQGETARIRAEVTSAGVPLHHIEYRICSQLGVEVDHGVLTRQGELYEGSWAPAMSVAPGSFDVLVRLPGAACQSLVTIVILPRDVFSSVQAALGYRDDARRFLENNDASNAVESLKSAIAAYTNASETEAAAEAMLDLAKISRDRGQLLEAEALYNEVLEIRERADDRDGADYCRTQLEAISATSKKSSGAAG